MADSEAQLEAGRRLASDLRAIRSKKAIDVKTVLDATRLADDVIEQLEETALIGNPMFNRVYLRSMLSSYASVLGIGHDEMMTALEDAMAGKYSGSLAKLYLDEVDQDVGEEPDADTEDAEDAAKEEAQSAEKGEAESETEEQSVDEEGSGEASSKALAVPSASEVEKEKESSDSKPTRPKKVVPGMKDVLAEPVFTSAASPKVNVLLPNMSGFLMLVIAGIIMIALVWFAVSWLLSPKEDLDQFPVAADSSAVAAIVMPERVLLADTFLVDLIAFRQALDPIRVKVDRDLRRPYWIEHLDTMTFEVQNQIAFEREVDQARILVSDYIIPPSWYSRPEYAELRRDRIQAWLDSLTSNGVYPPRSAGRE